MTSEQEKKCAGCEYYNYTGWEYPCRVCNRLFIEKIGLADKYKSKTQEQKNKINGQNDKITL